MDCIAIHWRLALSSQGAHAKCKRKINPNIVSGEFMRLDKLIPHWYEVQKKLFMETIQKFIATPEKYQAVNA